MSILSAPSRSHLLAVFRALTDAGWRIVTAPSDGRLARNGQKVVLRAGPAARRLRLFVYKVTGSGRQRPFERRIEITSTYQKGLRAAPGYSDVVLGFDVDTRLFVGVDPRRIRHGGATGNASSFFDVSGLSWHRSDEILVQARRVQLFSGGIEFHAFFRPVRLSEYLLNLEQIHSGTYAGTGPYSGRRTGRRQSLEVAHTSGEEVVLSNAGGEIRRRAVRRALVDAFESGTLSRRGQRKITPEELAEIHRKAEENGRLGEEIVITHERRALRRAGRKDLATKVSWISQQSVAEGFDILSFESDGRQKWIEVKATSGTSRSFEMSDAEWRVCCVAKNKYYIYRVTAVRTSPAIEQVHNPMKLEKEGRVAKSVSGWRVTLAGPGRLAGGV